MKQFITWLTTQKITYYLNKELKDYTTLHIGGKAKVIVELSSLEEMQEVLKEINDRNLKFFILGNGSNVLFEDEGYDGIILHIVPTFDKICVLDNNRVFVQSGANNAKLADFTCQNGLKGYEFACGIPGTIGGAIYMNAGAYDGQTSDVIESVRYLDKKGNIHTLDKEQLDFGYRHSFFTDHFGLIVDAIYQFESGDQVQIKQRIDDLMKRRWDKQPMDQYSAGSTFKRPENHYASKLIHDANLQGYSVGDAKVSDKHAGFLINEKNATSKQFQKLIKDVQDKVEELYDVKLECEIKHIK